MDLNETRIIDYDIQGRVDSAGLIYFYEGKEAIQNSIVVWLTSFKNDAINYPNRGGYLTQLLYKPMSEKNASNITEAIQDGFEQDYEPDAKLIKLNVVPNYEGNYWEIYLMVYINIIQDTVSVTQIIKNLV